MNFNSFRTHTQPPPPLWANIGDEFGTMILAEFPCLFNFFDYKYTPEEYEIWCKNTLSDSAGWMARLWNHPSVIMWVLTNESMRGGREREWETGPFRDFVRKLDPTRPTMRTGDTGTKENFDIHTCGNMFVVSEGDIHGWLEKNLDKVKGRTFTNSEYMNWFGRRSLSQWTNNEDRDDHAFIYAQLGLEHTEYMRRIRLDGIWPYMYAGWTKTRTGREWKAGFAKPVSAAWHSCMSGVLASLDLFDANYMPGQRVTTDLCLINDTWHDADIKVDLLLTSECPEFIPEADCLARPLAKWSLQYKLKADSIVKSPVKWELPDEEGFYWLTARTTGIPGRPVLSQRFVRTVNPPKMPAAAKKRTFVILGRDESATGYFEPKGLRTTDSLDHLKPGEHVVIVWRADKLTADQKQKAGVLCNFAAAGGKVMVFSTSTWEWKKLCDVKIGVHGGSRAFRCDRADHSMLTGIHPDWLKRWNGIPGALANHHIKGPAVEAGRRILWAFKKENTIVAEVPAARGGEKILFSQLLLQNHLDRSKPNYDPVADRIMVNLLSR